MDRQAMLSRIMDIVPERAAWSHTGTPYFAQSTAVPKHAERFAYLQQFLHWLTPLEFLTREDQQALGLLSGNGRPLDAAGREAGAELEEEEGEPGIEEAGLDEALDEDFEPVSRTSDPALEPDAATW